MRKFEDLRMRPGEPGLRMRGCNSKLQTPNSKLETPNCPGVSFLLLGNYNILITAFQKPAWCPGKFTC
jgi:hypothetical protein